MTLSPEVKDLLQDPEAIWEALSIDGVSYPFDSTLHGRNASERMEIAEKIKIFDDEVALAVGNMILAHQEEMDANAYQDDISADAVLGTIVRMQIIKHLEKIAESK
ncbi:MAG: hypothetical protein V3U97_02705 [bacterium]